MRNVSDKSCKENQNTYFWFNNFFFENCVIYEKMWKNIVQPDRRQMTVKYGAWKTEIINIDSEHVILIVFDGNNGYANAFQRHLIHILSVCLLYFYRK